MLQELLWQSMEVRSLREEKTRTDLLYATGEHPTPPCFLGGTRKTLHSLRVRTALVKENRLGLRGDASMEPGSLKFIEMVGFWNNRGQMVTFTTRSRVAVSTIMGQTLWQWLIGPKARKMDNQQDVT